MHNIIKKGFVLAIYGVSTRMQFSTLANREYSLSWYWCIFTRPIITYYMS